MIGTQEETSAVILNILSKTNLERIFVGVLEELLGGGRFGYFSLNNWLILWRITTLEDWVISE